MKRVFAILFCLGFVLVGTGTTSAVNYSYTELDIPGIAMDMNNSGTIVGTYYEPCIENRLDCGYIGFLYQGSTWTKWAHYSTPGIGDHFMAVNNNDAVAGWYYGGDANGLTLENGIFTDIRHPDYRDTLLMDINDTGKMVGFTFVEWGGLESTAGFLYDGSVFTVLESPAGEFHPCRINNNGTVIGSRGCPMDEVKYEDGDYTTSTWYSFNATTWKELIYPGATSTIPWELNNLNIVVGQYTDSAGKTHAFRFNGTNWVSGDYPGATETIAYDINDKGLIVGSYKDADGKRHGFSYINGVWSSLDYPGATDTYARLVNNNGLIVGSFTKDGQEGQFLATPLSTMAIDIRPWNSSNLISRKDWGLLPVAILSNSEFDAVNIMDLDTITFGPTGDEKSLAFCSPWDWDVNNDGYRDLICFFWTYKAQFQCGDAEGIIKGVTESGIHVEAKDSVRVIPCK